MKGTKLYLILGAVAVVLWLLFNSKTGVTGTLSPVGTVPTGVVSSSPLTNLASLLTTSLSKLASTGPSAISATGVPITSASWSPSQSAAQLANVPLAGATEYYSPGGPDAGTIDPLTGELVLPADGTAASDLLIESANVDPLSIYGNGS
jgi:hypothetical protein